MPSSSMKYQLLKETNRSHPFSPIESSFSKFGASFSGFAFNPDELDIFSRASELYGKLHRVSQDYSSEVNERMIKIILDMSTDLIINRQLYVTDDYKDKILIYEGLASKIRRFPWGKVIGALMLTLAGTLLITMSGIFLGFALSTFIPFKIMQGWILAPNITTIATAAASLVTGIGAMMGSGMLLYKASSKQTIVSHMERFQKSLTHKNKEITFEKNERFEKAWNTFCASYTYLVADTAERGLYSAAHELQGKIYRLYTNQNKRFSSEVLTNILETATFLISQRDYNKMNNYRYKLKLSEFNKLIKQVKNVPYGKLLSAAMSSLIGAVVLLASGILLAIGLGYLPPMLLVFGFTAITNTPTILLGVAGAAVGITSMLSSGMLVFKSFSKASLVKHMERFELNVVNPIVSVDL